MTAATPVPHTPSAEEITLATIREHAGREMKWPVPDPGTHAAGRRAFARDILAILEMHGRPPGEPVVFGAGPE